MTPQYSEVLQISQVWVCFGIFFNLFLFGHCFFLPRESKYCLTWFVWDMNGLVAAPGRKPFLHSLFLDISSCSLKASCCNLTAITVCIMLNNVNWDDLASAVLSFDPLSQPQEELWWCVFPEHNNIGPAPSWHSAPWEMGSINPSPHPPSHTHSPALLQAPRWTVTEDTRKPPEELLIFLRC